MNLELENLRQKANHLPLLPGVYIMLDSRSEVIYVGKAKKLKNRVTSYFHGDHLPKVAAMVDKVRDFNVIIAQSEFEALILENSLIKRHKPHYNILLKDDKGYPFIRMDLRAKYPRMTVASKAGNDGARYFGPFGGRGTTKSIIDSVSKALLLPDCRRSFPADIGKERPCLNYHLGTCEGWCRDPQGNEEYSRRIEQAVLILEGRSAELIEDIRSKMEAAAEEYRFELAARLRDRMRAIEGLANRQRVISTAFADTDAVAFSRGAICCFSIVHFVNGDLADKETFIIEDPLEDDNEVICDLLLRYYSERKGRCPNTILVQCEIEDREALEELLSEDNPRRVHIEVPQRGERKKLLEMAVMNASEEILRRTTEAKRTSRSVELLQKTLSLETLPSRIESFDISNLGDTGIVAAMTVFRDGRPLKRDYRKFRIRDLEVRDDYASMYQAVYRRFKRYCDHDGKFSELPDLLLIDGGATHAATALRALGELGISVPVFGMVKDDRHRTRALITPAGEEIGIQGNQAVYSLIGKIQEETHRFAIEYQRSLRYESYGSELDHVPGVGEKRKNDLLKTFKTVKAVKAATYEDLCTAVPKNTAKAVYEHYHNNETET
ncbi:MAG: excinuclease ABC subunit UvrC [Eubacteriales bacterium]|nr:excinuclease ABC subunit UvrC [Eubacteriales bacterium]